MNGITEMLLRPVYGDFVIWHVAAAGLGLALLFFVVPRLLKRDQRVHPYMGARTCGGCLWRGQVGQWNEQCPKCGKSFTT